MSKNLICKKCGETFKLEFKNQEYCKSCLNPHLQEKKKDETKHND